LKTSRQVLFIAAFVIPLALLSGCSKQAVRSAGALGIDLKVSPNHPSMTKPVTFEVHVTGADGHPVSDAEVNGALTMKLMDMGATQLKFTSKGNGDYQASVRDLDMSGPWSLAIDARRGSESAKQSFDVNVFD
jgi:nitrogen fixation protein FixH